MSARRSEPLWDRIDRNRVKMAFFIAAFIAALALSAEILVVLPLAVVAFALSRGSLAVAGSVAVMGVPLSFAIAVVWVSWALSTGERHILARLGAERVPTGELPETKRALHDMSLAAGFTYPPPLYVLDDPALNAFALGGKPERTAIGVTSGLLKSLSVDEQRAVFANLFARLRDGDVRVATVVSSLMAPVWAWRTRGFRGAEDELIPDEDEQSKSAEPGAFGCLPVLVLYVAGVIVSEFLYFGQMQQQILTSEAADARGMLLLKEPRAMLTALEVTVPADNEVVCAGAALAPLFFCWTGTAYSDERDPEMRRVERLRETLGVEGNAPEERRQ